MLRAYTFQFWLEQSSNGDIKKSVLGTISPETRHNKSSKPAPSSNTDARLPIINPPQSKKQKTSTRSVNGMHSLLNSRQRLLSATSMPPNHKYHEVSSTANKNYSFPLRDCKALVWKSIRLMSREELDVLVTSYYI